MTITFFRSRLKKLPLLVFGIFFVATLETVATEAVEGEYIVKFRSCDIPMDFAELNFGGELLKNFSAISPTAAQSHHALHRRLQRLRLR